MVSLSCLLQSWDTMHEMEHTHTHTPFLHCYNCFPFIRHPMDLDQHVAITSHEYQHLGQQLVSVRCGWSSSLFSAARREDVFFNIVTAQVKKFVLLSLKTNWKSSFSILEILDPSLQPATWMGHFIVPLIHKGVDLNRWRCWWCCCCCCWCVFNNPEGTAVVGTLSVFVQESMSTPSPLFLMCGAEMVGVVKYFFLIIVHQIWSLSYPSLTWNAAGL